VKAFLGIAELQPKTSHSTSGKIPNRKIALSLVLICSIVIIGTVGYIATMPSDSKNTEDPWTIYNYSLEANSQYTITLTAKDGYSFESWNYVTSTHWASTEYNTTQTTLTVSGDQMSLNAYFVPKDQSGKGSTASIILQASTAMQLDLEVKYGTGTVVQAAS
jgi:archaellum component FlaF (FlaF/FlaG flagellin family)